MLKEVATNIKNGHVVNMNRKPANADKKRKTSAADVRKKNAAVYLITKTNNGDTKKTVAVAMMTITVCRSV